MLVIGRKIGQRFRIGQAWVMVTSVDADGTVRLGVEAPRSVAVWREEIDRGQGANDRSRWDSGSGCAECMGKKTAL